MKYLLQFSLIGLISCGGSQEPDDIVLDDPVELPAPDLSDVDLKGAFEEAFMALATIDLRPTWAGHKAALDRRAGACPDIFAGNPDIEDIDIRTSNDGWSWMDFCDQSNGISFGGFQYWEIDVNVSGDPTTGTGRTTEASRFLFGDALVGDGDAVLYEFDGQATDGLTTTSAAGDYYTWSYSSQMDGTATGSLTFDGTENAGGYRVGLARRASGGVDQGLEANGNVYFFERRIHDRFDSISANFEFIGPEAAGPDECALEPQGYLSLRDQDAFWYDLVFSPRYEGDPDDPDYPNAPYSECDGCGTLYVRGLEQEGIEVCLDLFMLWGGVLDPPPVSEFAFTLRGSGG